MSGKNVLLVEDDDILQECFRFVLEQEGYRVCTAANGVEAVLDILNARSGKSEGEGIDFVLMDQLTPRLRGDDALKIIRKLEPDLPVAIMTAHPDMLEIIEASISGCSPACCIEKPVDMKTLVNIVRSFVA